MNKYELTEKPIKNKMGKKVKVSVCAQIVLLAIKRECDKQNKGAVELSDDEILALTNNELFIQCKNILIKFGEIINKPINEEKALWMIENYFILFPDKTAQDLCKDYFEECCRLKKMPKKMREKIVQNWIDNADELIKNYQDEIKIH